MAYSTPKIDFTKEPFTPAQANAIGNNIRYLKGTDGPITIEDSIYLAAGKVILWASDTQLQRGAANQLYTPDDFKVNTGVILDGSNRRFLLTYGNTTDYIVQSGNDVVLTNGAGAATVTYDTAFPNAVRAVVAVSGDAAQSMAYVKVADPLPLSGFNFTAYNTAGNTVNDTNVRVLWIATGY